MKLYIYDDGRESSIIHFSNNHIHATILKAHRRGKQFSSSSLGCSSKKKRTSSNGRFARCQFLVRLIILELQENCSWKKKGKIFTQNVTLFLKNARARERVHIYTEVDKMSGNTDVEKGNFAVKAGLAQVRDSHPRELARFSSVDGFSFLLRRRRHSFFLLVRVTSFFFFCSFIFFFVRRLIHSSQQRECKRKKSVNDDLYREACLFFLRRSVLVVVYVVVVTEEEENVNNKKMREGTSLFFLFFLSFMSEKKKLNNIIDRF